MGVEVLLISSTSVLEIVGLCESSVLIMMLTFFSQTCSAGGRMPCHLQVEARCDKEMESSITESKITAESSKKHGACLERKMDAFSQE
jgi:hypothetical protein